MEATYKAVRDYVIAAVKTAWPGVKVYKDPQELKGVTAYALVSLSSSEGSGIQVVETYSTRDRYLMQFLIYGRFARPASGSIDDYLAKMAGDLRASLCASRHPADAADLPRVTSLEWNQGDPQDRKVELTAVFTVQADVGR